MRKPSKCFVYCSVASFCVSKFFAWVAKYQAERRIARSLSAVYFEGKDFSTPRPEFPDKKSSYDFMHGAEFNFIPNRKGNPSLLSAPRQIIDTLCFSMLY